MDRQPLLYSPSAGAKMVGLLVTILFTYKTLEMVSAWWVLAPDNLYLTILVARYQEPIILLPSLSHQQPLKQHQQQQLKTQKNCGNGVRSLLELLLFLDLNLILSHSQFSWRSSTAK